MHCRRHVFTQGVPENVSMKTLFISLAVAVSSSSCFAGTLITWGTAQQNAPAGLTDVIAISASVDHSVALRSNGTVVQWGTSFDDSVIPSELTDATAVAAGDFFSLALRRNGTVVAWGDNELDQIRVPAQLTNVVAISAGRSHSLALRSDGTVVGWGSNKEGQTDVPFGLRNVTAILAKRDYSLAVRANGTIAAWGNGRLGETAIPTGVEGVVAVAGNEGYCLALKENGTLTGWGDQLPPIPAGLSGIVGIAAGETHCLARKADGSVIVWGSNDGGETSPPGGLGSVSALAAGWRYSAAISGSAQIAGPLSQPRMLQSTFQASISTELGTVYQVQYKDALTDSLWNPMPLFTGDGSSVIILDPTANKTQRFYRVVQH